MKKVCLSVCPSQHTNQKPQSMFSIWSTAAWTVKKRAFGFYPCNLKESPPCLLYAAIANSAVASKLTAGNKHNRAESVPVAGHACTDKRLSSNRDIFRPQSLAFFFFLTNWLGLNKYVSSQGHRRHKQPPNQAVRHSVHCLHLSLCAFRKHRKDEFWIAHVESVWNTFKNDIKVYQVVHY